MTFPQFDLAMSCLPTYTNKIIRQMGKDISMRIMMKRRPPQKITNYYISIHNKILHSQKYDIDYTWKYGHKNFRTRDMQREKIRWFYFKIHVMSQRIYTKMLQ
jgi:hypothetical protein